MKKRPPRKSIPVCIVSSHPLVLPELRRLLTRAGFGVHARRVEVTPKTDLHSLDVPAASIYVVDTHGADWAAEALVAGIRLQHPEARIVVVGSQFREVNSFPLLYLRVRGLVRYSEVRRQLARAVHIVAQGGLWAPRELITNFVERLLGNAHPSMRPPRRHVLSGREREIFECLLKNKANKQIADQLHISVSTVKFHVSNILSKFGVQRRTDLILRCFQDTAT